MFKQNLQKVSLCLSFKVKLRLRIFVNTAPGQAPGGPLLDLSSPDRTVPFTLSQGYMRFQLLKLFEVLFEPVLVKSILEGI